MLHDELTNANNWLETSTGTLHSVAIANESSSIGDNNNNDDDAGMDSMLARLVVVLQIVRNLTPVPENQQTIW